MRLNSNYAEFNKWLLDLGEGKLGEKLDIPEHFLTSQEDLITFAFGQSLATSSIRDFCSSAILCPKNEDTFALNEHILNLHNTSEVHEFLSVDQVESDDPTATNLYPTEFLNSITPSGFPLHKLKLKLNTPVILLRNLSVEDKLTNGTRMIVHNIQRNIIACRLIDQGELTERLCFIPRIDFISNGVDTPIPFRRRQFPIRVCFAMTINKSQGQTLDRVGLYLRTPCFTHGQLYVAFSRVRAPDKIKVCLLNDKDVSSTTNVVFTEIFE